MDGGLGSTGMAGAGSVTTPGAGLHIITDAGFSRLLTGGFGIPARSACGTIGHPRTSRFLDLAGPVLVSVLVSVSVRAGGGSAGCRSRLTNAFTRGGARDTTDTGAMEITG